MKLACIQTEAYSDPYAAADHALEVCRQALSEGAEFLALPEYCGGLETNGQFYIPPVFDEGSHPALLKYREFSGLHEVPMLIGSLAISGGKDRYFNRSYVLSPEGRIAARYDKIHLFDIDLGDGQQFQESATVQSGSDPVVAQTRIGQMGLSICYDLRFPALYRKLAQSGAEILAAPAAFTATTGQAHWHILNRARAIECLSYVIAPCMSGAVPGGGACYGHSLIVDPWGHILADAGEGAGYCFAEIDLARVQESRRKIPSLTHDQKFDMKLS